MKFKFTVNSLKCWLSFFWITFWRVCTPVYYHSGYFQRGGYLCYLLRTLFLFFYKWTPFTVRFSGYGCPIKDWKHVDQHAKEAYKLAGESYWVLSWAIVCLYWEGFTLAIKHDFVSFWKELWEMQNHLIRSDLFYVLQQEEKRERIQWAEIRKTAERFRRELSHKYHPWFPRSLNLYTSLLNSKGDFGWAYSIYDFLKSLFLVFIIATIYFCYMCSYFQINFLQQLAVWFVLGNLFFWLISGFNFFIKRALYGKFTSAIQRFWKRANMCFWLVEGFLFSLFYYYYLNSSQEPNFMSDYSSLNQDYLLSLVGGYTSLLWLSFLVFIFFFLQLSISYFTFYQVLIILVFMSFIIFKIFFLETYQFYYVITTFTENVWVFDEESYSWELEYEEPRLRQKTHYFLLCLMAKYWHFIFIFLSWIFFIMKVFEQKKITFTLLSLNSQNFIILYVLNLLTYIQWVKWVFRRFLDLVYFWFYTSYDIRNIELFWSEFTTLLFGQVDFSIFTFYYLNNIFTLYSNELFGLGSTYSLSFLNFI